jgi:hypothetical protein
VHDYAINILYGLRFEVHDTFHAETVRPRSNSPRPRRHRDREDHLLFLEKMMKIVDPVDLLGTSSIQEKCGHAPRFSSKAKYVIICVLSPKCRSLHVSNRNTVFTHWPCETIVEIEVKALKWFRGDAKALQDLEFRGSLLTD